MASSIALCHIVSVLTCLYYEEGSLSWLRLADIAFWKHVNSDWRIFPEARAKPDKKSVEAYKPRSFITVDVNENHAAVLVEDRVTSLRPGLEVLS